MHPGIVVDEAPKSPDHPRRVPLVLGRTLSFTDTGMSLLPVAAPRATLDVDEGGARLETSKGRELLPFHAGFHVRRHAFHLEVGNELLVDVRAVGTCIAFNCFHAGEGDVRWRGFAHQDPERGPLDVVVKGDRITYAPSTAGMPLEFVVDTTEAQRARMEPAVAAALAKPLLTAALDRARITALDVTATWDGASVVTVRSYRRRPSDEPITHALARAVTTFLRLAGREPPDVLDESHVEELRAAAAAPADAGDVAAVVRALFPEAWRVEQAVREQAGMLDVGSLLA